MNPTLYAASSVCLVLLSFGFVFSSYRIVVGPTLPDRVVALDTLGILILGILMVSTIRISDPALLDVAIVLALVGFMGTIAFARFLEKLSKDEEGAQ